MLFRSLALRLQFADLPGQAVALRLQLFGAGLDALAFGLERNELRAVQKGLRRLARLELGDDAVEVAAQLVDVEHVAVVGGGLA